MVTYLGLFDSGFESREQLLPTQLLLQFLELRSHIASSLHGNAAATAAATAAGCIVQSALHR